MNENTEKINNVINLIEDKKYLESTLDCLNNSKEYELSVINRNSNNLFISYSDTFNQILKNHYNAIIEEATLSLKEINLKLLDLLK